MAEPWHLQVDVVSLGSSGGGLTAAIRGHDLGLHTAVIEKEQVLGGGTALAGGTIWMPGNRQQSKAGLTDSREKALAYIRNTSFGRHDEAKTAAYLDRGPVVLGYLEDHTPLRLGRRPQMEDYYRHYAGATPGRAVGPDPVHQPEVLTEREGRQPLLASVRPSPTPKWTGGHGIIGALVSACVDRDIKVMTGVRATHLIVDNGKVVGVQAERNGQPYSIRAEKGVLIATGGFEWNQEMNRRFIPAPGRIFPITPPCNTGDGHIMGMEVGAAVALMDVTVQMAMSVTLDGETRAPGVAPSGKAGAIIVNMQGKRCCDETFYAAPGKAFRVTFPGRESAYSNYPLFTLADAKAVSPQAKDLPHVVRADTLEALARKIGIDPDSLEATVKRFNEHARQGVDPDFNRHYKAPFSPLPEPNEIGPVEQAPFYASRLAMSTAGHQGGLVTNTNAQVLNVRGAVIPGLYATSNAAAQLAVGAGYSSGQCIGQSLVFGFVAVEHMAGKGS